MASKQFELAMECKRQSESALYTSTALFIWLRFLRWVRVLFVVLPLVLGSLATWKLLTTSDLPSVRTFAVVCAFFAGLLPTIYAALKMDGHLNECRQLAGEFKNLQDRFRMVAQVSSQKSFAEFEAGVEPLMQRLELARSVSFTAPEWCFKRGQAKVKSGDYDFDVDIAHDGKQETSELN